MAVVITIFEVKGREAEIREIIRKYARSDYDVIEGDDGLIILREKLSGKEMMIFIADFVIWAEEATYFSSTLLRVKNIGFSRTSKTFSDWEEVRSSFKMECQKQKA